MFFCITESVAYAGPVNSNGIKALLAHCFSTFFIKGKPIFSNDRKSLPENCPDCPVLCN